MLVQLNESYGALSPVVLSINTNYAIKYNQLNIRSMCGKVKLKIMYECMGMILLIFFIIFSSPSCIKYKCSTTKLL